MGRDDVGCDPHVMDDETVGCSPTPEPTPIDSSTDGPAAVAPPGRSRLAVAMFVLAGVLLIGAVVFGGLGLQAQSDASDQRDQAVAAGKARRASAHEQQSLDADRAHLEGQVRALPDKYGAIGTAYTNLGQSYTRYLDLMSRSVDLYNAGDTPGSVAVLTGDGTTALSELTTKQTEAQQAVQAAEDTLHQIQEGL